VVLIKKTQGVFINHLIYARRARAKEHAFLPRLSRRGKKKKKHPYGEKKRERMEMELFLSHNQLLQQGKKREKD